MCSTSHPNYDQAALVSYHDPDAGLSDEERSPVPMDLESDAEADGEGNEEDTEAEVKPDIITISIFIYGHKCRRLEKMLRLKRSTSWRSCGRQDLVTMEWDSVADPFLFVSFLSTQSFLGLTISQEGVKLPPEPPGHCSKELQVTNPFKSSKRSCD